MIAAGITTEKIITDICPKLGETKAVESCNADARNYDAAMMCSAGPCDLKDPPVAPPDTDTSFAAQNARKGIEAHGRLSKLLVGDCNGAYGVACIGAPPAPPAPAKECMDDTQLLALARAGKRAKCDTTSGDYVEDTTAPEDEPSSAALPDGGLFFQLNFRAGSGINTEGEINIPGITGDMEVSDAPLGAGLRVGYGWTPGDFLLRAYAGVESVFPFSQTDAYGNRYRPDNIWQFFGGFAPYYLVKAGDSFRIGLGLPVEVGYSSGSADLTINAPTHGEASYPFLRFGPEALFRIPTGGGRALELGAGYLWTPAMGDGFGQHTDREGDLRVQTSVGEHLFMLKVGLEL